MRAEAFQVLRRKPVQVCVAIFLCTKLNFPAPITFQIFTCFFPTPSKLCAMHLYVATPNGMHLIGVKIHICGLTDFEFKSLHVSESPIVKFGWLYAFIAFIESSN